VSLGRVFRLRGFSSVCTRCVRYRCFDFLNCLEEAVEVVGLVVGEIEVAGIVFLADFAEFGFGVEEQLEVVLNRFIFFGEERSGST